MQACGGGKTHNTAKKKCFVFSDKEIDSFATQFKMIKGLALSSRLEA